MVPVAREALEVRYTNVLVSSSNDFSRFFLGKRFNIEKERIHGATIHVRPPCNCGSLLLTAEIDKNQSHEMLLFISRNRFGHCLHLLPPNTSLFLSPDWTSALRNYAL